MIEKIISKTTLIKALIATALFVIMSILINLSPIGVAGLTGSTNGASILDLEMFGYSAEKAYSMLEKLGANGRDFYSSKILPMDFFFPLTYTLFFISWIAYFLKPINSKRILYFLFLIPILLMLFDFSENICILIMLNKYPAFLKGLYTLSGIFTILKTIFMVLSIISLIVLLIIFILKIRKAKTGEIQSKL